LTDPARGPPAKREKKREEQGEEEVKEEERGASGRDDVLISAAALCVLRRGGTTGFRFNGIWYWVTRTAEKAAGEGGGWSKLRATLKAWNSARQPFQFTDSTEKGRATRPPATQADYHALVRAKVRGRHCEPQERSCSEPNKPEHPAESGRAEKRWPQSRSCGLAERKTGDVPSGPDFHPNVEAEGPPVLLQAKKGGRQKAKRGRHSAPNHAPFPLPRAGRKIDRAKFIQPKPRQAQSEDEGFSVGLINFKVRGKQAEKKTVRRSQGGADRGRRHANTNGQRPFIRGPGRKKSGGISSSPVQFVRW